jgi:hypothetical protein
MAITQAMCTSFKEDLLQKEQNLETGGDTIKIALFTSSANLDSTTTTYTGQTGEVSGTGYTSGGVALTNQVVATSGTTAYFDADDPEWTSASFTTAGALIYNDTLAGKNAIAVLSFGGDFTVTSGTFRIVFPAPGAAAIVRID